MTKKNIPLGDDKARYVTARVHQIFDILKKEDITQIANHLQPNMEGDYGDMKEYRTMCEGLVTIATATLAKAEFDTKTQHDPVREVLVSALEKASPRDTTLINRDADVVSVDFGNRTR